MSGGILTHANFFVRRDHEATSGNGQVMSMSHVVILGGGCAGFTLAQKLEKQSSADLQVTLVDMRPYYVYQPFLAEVSASSLDPRNVEVPLAKNLPHTHVVCAKVQNINHAAHTVRVADTRGTEWDITYDQLVVSLGAVTRTFPIPGIADYAVGLKSTEEAAYIRNKVIENFYTAPNYPKGSPERKKLLTFIVVGGGFSGIECFAELTSLIAELCEKVGQIDPDEVEFHMIEAMDHILPDLPRSRSEWVIKLMESRGAHVHLSTTVDDATDSVVKTSDGKEYPTELIIWTAGQMANPVLKNSDLPLEPRGRLRCQADLRVVDEDGNVIPDVWGMGDCAAIPDVTGGGMPDGTCGPTGQHAARQAKQLAKNLVAIAAGGEGSEYRHENLGMVAGLGKRSGVFVTGSKKFGANGWFAWKAHRIMHALVLPTWDRRRRVISDWRRMSRLGKDLTTTINSDNPFGFFREFAQRPKENK